MVSGSDNTRRKALWNQWDFIQSSEDIFHSKIILDLSGNIIQCDKSAEAVIHYPSDDIPGKKIHQLLPLKRQRWKAYIRALKKGNIINHSWKSTGNKPASGTRYVFMTLSLAQRPVNSIIASIFACDIPSIPSIEKNQQLAAIIESSDDAIIGKTLDGVITSWNKAAEKIYGYTEKEAIGQHIDLIVPDSKKGEFREIMRQLRRGNSIEHLETKRITKQGNELDISLSISPVKDDHGKLAGASAIARDITEKKQLERDFQQNVANSQVILDNISEAIISMTDEGIIKSFNRAAEKIFGYDSREMVNHNVNVLLEASKELVLRNFLQRDSDIQNSDIVTNERELQGKRKDGSTFPLRVSFNSICIDDRLSYVCVITDLTNQRSLEQKIVETGETEQLRLASYLHDDIGQTLSGLRLMSLNLGRILSSNGIEGAEKINEMSELIQQVDEKIRNLARGLLASRISPKSLTDALKQLKIKSENLYNIQCELEINSSTRITEETSIQHVYRISQEAIRNAVIHGKADKISIVLDERPHNLLLEITDNGTGFSEPHGTIRDDDHGISTMKYRAHLLGGRLDLSGTAEGVKLSCILPTF